MTNNTYFNIGDILHFEEYIFTDTGTTAQHYALLILPEIVTKYEDNILCCVISSKEPKRNHLVMRLDHNDYTCFNKISYVYFNRKDLQPKSGLSNKIQPVGKLSSLDMIVAFKKLKNSLFAIEDIGSKWYKAAIFREWKKVLNIK